VDEGAILSSLTQLGAAGLIGWLWLCERRASLGRDRQIEEAHARIMLERESASALLGIVRENTEAVAGLRETQRSLGLAIDRLAVRLGEEGAGAGGSRRAG